jgi:uncharacterized protein DUF2630
MPENEEPQGFHQGDAEMSERESDRPVQKHIEQLVKEEHRLYEQKQLSEVQQRRLTDIKVELDQCWDLLRQRRARRDAGQDPDTAAARDPSVVERYEQ